MAFQSAHVLGGHPFRRWTCGHLPTAGYGKSAKSPLARALEQRPSGARWHGRHGRPRLDGGPGGRLDAGSLAVILRSHLTNTRGEATGLCRWGVVARRSKIHEGYSPAFAKATAGRSSSRLAPEPNTCPPPPPPRLRWTGHPRLFVR